MSPCPAFTGSGAVRIPDALRSIDCMSGQVVELAFGRLFGPGGGLGIALTAALTLYVGFFALSLLTGRASLRINMLTPRMLQLGLVLTFATSWVAYQAVAWNLLVGAPDQIAGILLGTKGSATELFARRIDTLFDVIADSARQAAAASPAVPGMPPSPESAAPRPATILWAASLLLLLGTVGVLIVARLALAALIALGPIFIVLALFSGTRELFAGWLRAAVMLALAPLFAVLLGGGTLVMILPLIRALRQAGGQVSLEQATAVFLAAFVYVSLMILAMRAARMITGSWTFKGRSESPASSVRDSYPRDPGQQNSNLAQGGYTAPPQSPTNDSRLPAIAALAQAFEPQPSMEPAAVSTTVDALRRIEPAGMSEPLALPPVAVSRDPRLRPLGQGFRSPGVS